ncbi:hypothetical protein [Candidatus Tisiphia endosymbiont of Ditula angustiorana]|uniref:hypothetical protein n=1 Tax=Candidatus Tisiphia endosymbiont of Ditula angustiorana TaxID=3066272 RepID=UPI00312C8FA1
MKNKVRIFSAEAKTKIVLELLKEDITLSQLSSKYEVNAKSIASVVLAQPCNIMSHNSSLDANSL